MRESYENVKNWRRNNKLRMVEAFGGSCGICGYDRCFQALEFHHLEPDKKDFDVGTKIKSQKLINEELAKCVMLCSNCHREIHANIIEIPDDITRFDEDLYIKIYKKNVMDDCPVCGNKKNYKRKVCSIECSGILRRRVEWNTLDLGVLLEKHDNNFCSVGRFLGISDNAVRKRARKIGLIS